MSVTTSRPVVSQISDEIVQRLSVLISAANAVFSFKDVVRPSRLATYTPEHGLIVLTRGDMARVPDMDSPGNPPAMAWQQTFLIRVHIGPSERDSTASELFEDVAHAEIVKAIRNSDTWHTFDDNAFNADFAPVVTTTSDGGYDGIAIPLIVFYRVAEDDPYTVRA